MNKLKIEYKGFESEGHKYYINLYVRGDDNAYRQVKDKYFSQQKNIDVFFVGYGISILWSKKKLSKKEIIAFLCFLRLSGVTFLSC